MTLKTILESLDDLDDGLKGLYEEKDGKFVLKVDGIDEHPAVANLRNAYQQEKAKRKAQGDELAALKEKYKGLPEDFDPAEYEKLKAGKGGKDDEHLRVALKKEFEKQLAEKEAELAKAQRDIQELTVERGLSEALTAAGIVNPVFQRAARALLKDAVTVDRSGDVPKAVIDTDMGPVPLADYVKTWASSDEGKVFVEPAKGAGAKGGNGGGGEVNPYAKDTFNRTEQGRLEATNPAKAAALKAAARAG